jgi:hypothetical protein
MWRYSVTHESVPLLKRRHFLGFCLGNFFAGSIALPELVLGEERTDSSSSGGQRAGGSGQPIKIKPEFGADRKLSPEFWSSLPTRAWIEVLGTRMDQLVGQLPPGFKDLGVEGFSAVTADWSGAAFDPDSGRFWCSGGGHMGSNNNGLYEFSLETMAWRVAMTPSIYTPADLEKSRALWNATAKKWITFSQGYDVNTDWWKDQKPAALHTYGDIEFVPGIGVVRGGLMNYWHYDIAAGTATKTVPIAQWAPGIQAIYDRANKLVVRCGKTGDEYWGIQRYDPFKAVALPIQYLKVVVTDPATGTQKAGPSSQFSWNGAVTIDIGNRKLFAYNGAKAWTLHLDSFAGTEVVLRDPFGTDSPAVCGQYIPELQRCVMLMRSGGIGFIDPATGQCGTLPVTGVAPPPSPSIANGVYGRWRWYAKRHCMALVPATGENIRLIRLG